MSTCPIITATKPTVADVDAAPTPTPTICVVICTRNRAGSLDLSLSSLNALEVPMGWMVECVLVDNGSTDDTPTVLGRFAASCPLQVRVVTEPQPGLSAARNAALRSTHADVIAFTDDDCLPQADWLLQLCAHFSQPDASPLVGGRVELYDPADLPITINTSTVARLIERPSMNLTSIMGCNFAFRREIVERIGLFDERLGAGAQFISAEDTDFLYRALKGGLRLAYDPTITVQHKHGRRTESDRGKLMRGYAIGRGAMYCKHWLARDPLALRSLFWDLRDSLKASFDSRHTRIHRKLCLNQLWQVCMGFVQAWPLYRKQG